MNGVTKRNIKLMLLRWASVFSKKAEQKHYELMKQYRKEIIANRTHYKRSEACIQVAREVFGDDYVNKYLVNN